MFKRIICATLCLCLVACLCGCSAPKNGDGSSKLVSSEVSSLDTSSAVSEASSAVSSQVSSMVSSQVSSAVSSAVSKLDPIPTESRVIKALGDDTYKYLMSLSATRRSWGQGLEFDDKNRPIYSLSAQSAYGRHNACYIMDDEMKIYLTFDEGYEYNNNTAKILDTLKEKGVSAVFFVTGHYVESRPDLVRRMINEGHIVGNHSWAHPDYTTKTLEQAYDDIKKLHDYVEKEFGYTMSLFRFPSGVSSDRLLALVKEMGYKSVFWSFAYADWDTSKQPDEKETLELILNRAHPGAVPLLHAVSNTNTKILGQVIDGYRQKGYELCAFPLD